MFTDPLATVDPAVSAAISREDNRQRTQIELIASENIVSRAVLETQGSILTNKYAEGYAGRRYYGGCEFVDETEVLAIDRAKQLFGCEYVNVQPHSGAQANAAVMLALVKPGDTILGMALDAGGHLTHGAKAALAGKWFNAVQYGVTSNDALLDYDEILKLTLEHKPKLIIAGASAYSRVIDFARFREIADQVGALLMVDMAHIAGLVATGFHPSPIGIADVITTTTHKTLRGPRGGMILTSDASIAKKINSAVFPGSQGGPLMHVIAAKAVAFGEALRPEFREYISRVVESARALASVVMQRGCDVVSNGTDNHIVLVDLRPKGVVGSVAADTLEAAGITCNKNGVPGDPEKPTVTSGIRLGTAAGCTRGFGPREFTEIGNLICDVLDGIAVAGPAGDPEVQARVKRRVEELCAEFPIYE